MSTTTARELKPAAPPSLLRQKADWWWGAALGLAFVLFFWHLIERSFLIITEGTGWIEGFKHLANGQFNTDWSHGLLLPVISVFCIVQNRERLAQTPKRLCWLGLLMLFQGMISFALWISPGRNDMLQGYSAVFALFGLVLFLLGPGAMRILWFPIVFLALGVKISDRFWEQIAWTLQWAASQTAARLLTICGLDASVDGSTITLFRGAQFVSKLNVAEACSGLHMLMAFIALGTAVAFLSDRPTWQRWIIVASTVPIAVLVNAGRVTAIGLLTLINPEMSQGNFHTFVGMLMLIPAFGLFLLLGWVLDHLLIAQEPDQSTERANEKPAESSAGGQAVATSETRRVPFPGWQVAVLGAVIGVINVLLLLGFFLFQRVAENLFGFAGRYRNFAFATAWLAGMLVTWALAWRVDQMVHGGCRPTQKTAAKSAAANPVIGTSPAEPDDASGPPAPKFPAILNTVGWGAVLTLLVGAAYGLMLGTIRPDFFIMQSIGSPARTILAGLLAVDLVLLAATSGLILRRLYAPAGRRLAALLAGRGIALGALLAAVVALMGILKVNGVVMIKESLPLRRSLSEVTQAAGTWRMEREDPPLSAEIEDALGTKDYISRVYVDGSMPAGEPGSVVRLHVTYYTGKADTVPHVPWRCWVAGGIEPQDIGDTNIKLEGSAFRQDHGAWYAVEPLTGRSLRISDNPLTATIFSYAAPPPARGGNVVYFFVANGKFLKSPELVRQKGFDPSDRYSYYAKVEVMVDQLPDQKEAAARVSAFLSAMLPDVLSCLPDWEQVTQQQGGGSMPAADSK